MYLTLCGLTDLVLRALYVGFAVEWRCCARTLLRRFCTSRAHYDENLSNREEWPTHNDVLLLSKVSMVISRGDT